MGLGIWNKNSGLDIEIPKTEMQTTAKPRYNDPRYNDIRGFNDTIVGPA